MMLYSYTTILGVNVLLFFFYRYDTFESTKVRRSRVYFLYIMLFAVFFLTAILMAIALTLKEDFQ